MTASEEIQKLKSTPFIFVLGTGRSGTTLLQSMLDAHPNIVAPPETKFMAILYPEFSALKKWGERDIKEFIEALKIDPQFVEYWNIDWERLYRSLIDIKENADYALICKMVYYQMRRDKQDIRLISDKNPLYILFIDKFCKLFPEAKFIHIVRDPRAVINSTIQTFGMKNIVFNSQGWVIENSIIEKNKERNPSKYFTMQYEKLVENTEGTLKELCGFLNILYNPVMLQHKIPDLSHNPEFEKKYLEKIHKSLTKPVNVTNINKWENELNPDERKIIGQITWAYAKNRYGYKIDVPAAGIHSISYSWKKLIFQLWVAFTRFRFGWFKFNLWYARNFKKGRIGEAY